jgi:AcrR family transcriptional regulator
MQQRRSAADRYAYRQRAHGVRECSPSVESRDGERTKEAILIAAEDCFARRGYEGTSMQEIGEAAARPPTFFRSKEALYEAVLTRVVARAETELASAHDGNENRSPEEAVTFYV